MKHYNFENINIGDYVKFKIIDKEKEKDKEEKNETYYAIVTDSNNNSKKDKKFLGIQIDEKDKRYHFPIGLTIYIDRRAVIQVYPPKVVDILNPRISIRHLWKNLIFREVKTAKTHNLLYIEYKYICSSGLERIMRFNSWEEAKSKVDPKFHKNLYACHENYFGFTTDKCIRNNDNYLDHEIFFSKKCYCELDWSDNDPTADFSIIERGFLNTEPEVGTTVCGIVENGEKGLFYRKWFLCSKQFLMLWSMLCEPTHPSLYISEDKSQPKSFNMLLEDLDTSQYSFDIKKKIENFTVYNNIEQVALYSNRYKQVAKALYNNEISNSFQKKLIRNLIWPSKITI